MEVKRQKEIYVIGHKNPDTDSVCSAIAYASLKNEILSRVHQGDSIEHYQDFLIEGEESGRRLCTARGRSVNTETNYVCRSFAKVPVYRMLPRRGGHVPVGPGITA